MRFHAMFTLLILMLPATFSQADEAAVRKMVSDYATAFNDKNLEAVAGFWSENGVHIDRDTGERTEGREALKQDIAAAFEQNPGARLVGQLNNVRFVKPDVASVDGEVVVSLPGEDPSRTIFHAILVEQDGKWLIDTIEETTEAPPESSSEALRELEWLIGSWVDEGTEARVDTSVRWAANGAFLLRSFTVTAAEGVVREGTQVIGWDPRSGEIRSWSFQSDGSFGDGTWSKSGNDWLVKSSQTLADGNAASGTFVYTPINENEVSIRLISHEIEGEPQPADAAITLKRVTEPQATSDASSTN